MSLDWLREGMLSASGNKIHVIIIKVFWLIYLCRRVFKIKLVSWNGKQRGAIACQQNSIIEMLRWKKMDRDIALHLLSCSPKHAWPASNLKRQGWRDFWRMAKSPVERKRNAQAYLALIALFSYVTQSWSLAVKGVLCILGYPHGFRYWIVMCDFFFHRWVGLQCLKPKTNGCLQRLPVPSVLSNAYSSTYSDHEGNSADHLQNERDT